MPEYLVLPKEVLAALTAMDELPEIVDTFPDEIVGTTEESNSFRDLKKPLNDRESDPRDGPALSYSRTDNRQEN